MRRISEPRIRKSAKAKELAKLRAARNKATKAGNEAEVQRIEGILGNLIGM